VAGQLLRQLLRLADLAALVSWWTQCQQTDSPPSHLMSRHLYSRIGVVCVVVLLYTGTVPVVSNSLVYAEAAVFEETGVKLYDALLSFVKKT
jgi:hypothetical protein